ncbi:MAG: hypothetical protein KC413_11015 [Anaerolineales bacterium]|nr:hypothetical protein [Anaerolineales bacterium]MCA9976275.1 hypothetical protein [Anaerolineales bacterium]MCB8966303.1 hypothetical protein [Ardenticatenaceae bacterium]
MDAFVLTVGTVIIVAVLLLLFTRAQQRGRLIALRPLPAYNILHDQIGQAVESGSQLHLTLGQAGLTSVASPTSIASLTILDTLAKDGCANGTPPLVTVGEGTLLPAAQDSLLHAYNEAQFTSGFQAGAAQFIAAETDPFAYAAGVTSVIHHARVSNNVAVGRFGAEMALIASAAERASAAQVIGTDDPIAMALARAVTDNVLIGEELLAAGAYLQGSASQLASVRVQDLLRLLIALIILGIAFYQLFTAFFG